MTVYCDDLRGATVRAVSAEPSADLDGFDVRADGVRVPIAAPHVHVDGDAEAGSQRGSADGIALRLLRSDPELHRRLQPSDPVVAWIFEVLEQLRVESLVGASLPGVTTNLRHRYVRWCLAVHGSGVTSTASGLLLYTTVEICRARITQQPVVEQTEDLLEGNRAALSPLIGSAVASLRSARTDQARYAELAIEIGERVSELLDEDVIDAATNGESTSLTLYLDPSSAARTPRVSARRHRQRGRPEHAYRAFDTTYDRQHDIHDLVRTAQLEQLRHQLDERVQVSGLNVRRLARDLYRLFREPRTNGWSGGHEHGYVDGLRLSSLVTSPDAHDIFVQAGVELEPRSRVSILVDCSGSMKPQLEHVVVFVDVLGHALTLAGIPTDILGFTTGAWNGGRTLREWQRAREPRMPGRLNELSHLVFKDADVPWHKGRSGVAGLLRTDLFREGIDGEAIQWACSRMPADSGRRVVIVVSDGSPMDSATARANGDEYLDDHLRSTIAAQERRGTEVIGVGMGTDLLTRYYPRSLALDLNEDISMRTYRELLTLIGARGSVTPN